MDDESEREARRALLRSMLEEGENADETTETNHGTLWTETHEKDRNIMKAGLRFEEFVKFMKETKCSSLLPGNPSEASYYFKKTSEHINHGAICAYLQFVCGTSMSYLDDVPSLAWVCTNWWAFRRYYLAKRGEAVPRAASIGITAYLQSLIDEGLASDDSRPRILTSPNGLMTIAEQAWNPMWASSTPAVRLQFTLYQALMCQGALRNTGLLGRRQEVPLILGNFVIYLARIDDDDNNKTAADAPRVAIAAKIIPRNEKTLTAEGTGHLLAPVPQLYRNPIFLLLVRAQQLDAMPIGLDLDDLEGSLGDDELREFQFTKPNALVFTSDTDDEVVLLESRINKVLSPLCELAGMDRPITTHSYRTICIHYMNLGGIDLAAIQRKVGHVLRSEITDVYQRPLPPVDIASIVYNQPSRQEEAITLHPTASLPTIPPPVIDRVPNPLSAPVPDTHDAYLGYMRDILFSTIPVSKEAVSRCAMESPPLSLSRYPPGSLPVNNVCPGCAGTLPIPQSNLGARTYTVNRFHREHVVVCEGYRVVQDNLETLIDRYPAKPARHTFPWPDSTRLLKHIKTENGVEYVNLETLAKTAGNVTRPPCCGTKYTKTSAFRAHMVMEHHYWLDVDMCQVNALFDEGKLRAAAYCLPPAEYSWFKGAWIWDPREKEIAAMEEHEARFGASRLPHAPHGVRMDIDMPKNNFDIPYGLPDLAYEGDAQRFVTKTRSRVCFFCVHATENSFTVRMADYKDYIMAHNRAHFKDQFILALKLLQGQAIGHHLCSVIRPNINGVPVLVCPDAVCTSHHTTFDSPLQLLWHLCAVHMLDLGPGTSVPERTFDSDDELRYYLATAVNITVLVSESKKAFRDYRLQIDIAPCEIELLPDEVSFDLNIDESMELDLIPDEVYFDIAE